MVIQEIDFKKRKEQELWYRSRGEICAEEKLVFEKNAVFSTDTYYSSFCIKKWKLYCNFQKISLNVRCKGMFLLKLYQADVINDEIVKKEIAIENIEAEAEKEISFLLPEHIDGMVYFTIEALKEESYIKRITYEGDCKKKNDITIALNICTYKREKALYKNLSLLQDSLLGNEKEELGKHLKVFVTDNGKTVDAERYTGKNIYITPNENVGGAGGFTRGLVEILKKKEEHKISHIIFMDDDIEFEVEAMKRTYILLCAMKEEYKKAFIGGAMLRMDKQHVQNENGAWWNHGGIILRNSNMDLTDFKNVLKNDHLEEVEYAAWFFCCIPIEIAGLQNLPLPIFIHCDDVEYSLRNTKQVITMNGIAVSHPVVAHKCASSNCYYDLRNSLIVNACHCNQSYTKKIVKKRVLKELINAFLKYRYKDMHLIFLALEDFCRGPEWLYELDGAEYHKKIQKMGYTFSDVSGYVKGNEELAADYENTTGFLETFRVKPLREKIRVLIQLITLNGWLLPAKNETGVFYMNVRPRHMYRKKNAVLYDEVSMDGIVVEKSYKQIAVFLQLLVKSNRIINKKFAVSKEAYYNKMSKLCSIEYWNEKYHYNTKM